MILAKLRAVLALPIVSAARSLGQGAEESGCGNSFTAVTPVLLADGHSKPIRDVRAGDLVRATDPTTGETAARQVLATIIHGGPHRMVDVRESDGSSVTATDHHPFFNVGTNTFVDAIDLRPGDRLHTADGGTIAVAGTQVHDENLTAYNLTIDDLHTYYAGTTPELVHNSCADNARILSENMEASGIARPAETAAHHIVASGSRKAATAQQQLDQFGIDINYADNGVFLPRGSASANPSSASVHSRIHTNEYYSYVNDLIGGARNAGEARDVLGYSRGQLLGGYWP